MTLTAVTCSPEGCPQTSCAPCHTKCCTPMVNSCTDFCEVDWSISGVAEFIGLDAFIPRVQAKLALSMLSIKYDMVTLPNELIELAVRDACITFAKRTMIVTRSIKMDFQCNVADYYLELCGEEQIYQVRKVFPGCNPSFGYAVNGYGSGIPIGCGFFMEHAYKFMPPYTLMVSPAPFQDQVNAVGVQVVSIPREDCCKVDKLFYDRCQSAIIAGALAELLSVGAPALAKKFEQQFEFAISEEANTQFKQGMTSNGSYLRNTAIG